MKKITLALSGLLIIQLANAQVSKGSIFTGGSVNVTTTTVNYSAGQKVKSNSWSVSPQLGTAIQQDKILSVQLLAGGYKSENLNAGTSVGLGSSYWTGYFLQAIFSLSS